MRKKLMFSTLLSFGVLMGCNGQEESLNNNPEYMAEKNNQGNPYANEPDYSPNVETNYDAMEYERARPRDKNIALRQGPKKDTPMDSDNANSFNNIEFDRQSREIGKRLSQNRFVKTAQVVITNEKVIVAVEEPDRATYTRVDVSEKVRKLVTQMPETKGKEIVIYTDERYWDRMKDIRSRLNQRDDMPKEQDQFGDDYSR